MVCFVRGFCDILLGGGGPPKQYSKSRPFQQYSAMSACSSVKVSKGAELATFFSAGDYQGHTQWCSGASNAALWYIEYHMVPEIELRFSICKACALTPYLFIQLYSRLLNKTGSLRCSFAGKKIPPIFNCLISGFTTSLLLSLLMFETSLILCKKEKIKTNKESQSHSSE